MRICSSLQCAENCFRKCLSLCCFPIRWWKKYHLQSETRTKGFVCPRQMEYRESVSHLPTLRNLVAFWWASSRRQIRFSHSTLKRSDDRSHFISTDTCALSSHLTVKFREKLLFRLDYNSSFHSWIAINQKHWAWSTFRVAVRLVVAVVAFLTFCLFSSDGSSRAKFSFNLFYLSRYEIIILRLFAVSTILNLKRSKTSKSLNWRDESFSLNRNGYATSLPAATNRLCKWRKSSVLLPR